MDKLDEIKMKRKITDECIELLKKQIEKIESLKSRPSYNPKYKIWKQFTLEILRKYFKEKYADMFDGSGPNRMAISEEHRYKLFLEDLEEKKGFLEGFIEEKKEFENDNIAVMDFKKLIQYVNTLRDIMISVSTGEPPTRYVNEYITKYQEVDETLKLKNFENPNPYSDLGKWRGKWSSGDLPTYQSRRQYIANMYDPLIKELNAIQISKISNLFVEVTGWTRVDRGVDKIKKQLEEAKNEEDFQSVGLFCREALISVAQEVYDLKKHKILNGVNPSNTDANRMLEAYIETELGGSNNEVVRRVVKSSLALANELQHRRTATFREAALCAQAAFTVINMISIVSGHIHP